MKKILSSFALSLVGIVTSTHAAISFVDPSFENGGSTTMAGPTYVEDSAGTFGSGGVTTGVWYSHKINLGNDGGILEDKDTYLGFTSAPAGVTGEQFLTSSRATGNTRGNLQFASATGATGLHTFSVDYWVHEQNAADPVDGDASIIFEVVAFNTGDSLDFDIQGPATQIPFTDGWQAKATTGFVTYAAVDATTGFQTLSLDLDLGTGYDFVGIAFAEAADAYNPSNPSGETVSYDNITVTPIPEPSSFALLAGIFGLAWIMVRRRG